MEGCVFCRIADGEIPSTIVYGDNKTMAILDISPANKGHVLVIPKEHNLNFDDLDDETLKNVFSVARKLVGIMKKSLDFTDYNLLINNGHLAGQIVKHLHLHIIPRYENDGVDFNWTFKKYDEGEIQRFGEKIKEEL